MRDKIDRRAAAAEAKMQLGSASVDTQMQEIEREALDMQLQDKLLAYKRDMGLVEYRVHRITTAGIARRRRNNTDDEQR
jgi:phage shock protein A